MARVHTRSRARRRITIAGLVALGGLLAYGLIGLPFFVFPAQDPIPRHADAAFVLGHPSPQRLAIAYKLRYARIVDTVFVSEPGPGGLRARYCSSPHTICRSPVPVTTQGEARMLADEAEQHHWTSIVVITQTAHLDRARTVLRRCFNGAIAMRESSEPPTDGWVYQYLYQTGATVKAWFSSPGC